MVSISGSLYVTAVSGSNFPVPLGRAQTRPVIELHLLSGSERAFGPKTRTHRSSNAGSDPSWDTAPLVELVFDGFAGFASLAIEVLSVDGEGVGQGTIGVTLIDVSDLIIAANDAPSKLGPTMLYQMELCDLMTLSPCGATISLKIQADCVDIADLASPAIALSGDGDPSKVPSFKEWAQDAVDLSLPPTDSTALLPEPPQKPPPAPPTKAAAATTTNPALAAIAASTGGSSSDLLKFKSKKAAALQKDIQKSSKKLQSAGNGSAVSSSAETSPKLAPIAEPVTEGGSAVEARLLEPLPSDGGPATAAVDASDRVTFADVVQAVTTLKKFTPQPPTQPPPAATEPVEPVIIIPAPPPRPSLPLSPPPLSPEPSPVNSPVPVDGDPKADDGDNDDDAMSHVSHEDTAHLDALKAVHMFSHRGQSATSSLRMMRLFPKLVQGGLADTAPRRAVHHSGVLNIGLLYGEDLRDRSTIGKQSPFVKLTLCSSLGELLSSGVSSTIHKGGTHPQWPGVSGLSCVAACKVVESTLSS